LEVSKNKRYDIIHFDKVYRTTSCIVCGFKHSESTIYAHTACWETLTDAGHLETERLCDQASDNGIPLYFNRTKFLNKYQRKVRIHS
jgi:hypothetical protein